MVTLKVALDASGITSGVRQGVSDIGKLTSETEKLVDATDLYGLTGTRIWTAQETAARAAAESIRRAREQQEAASRAAEAAADRVRTFNRAAGAANEIVSTTSRVRLLGEEVRNLGNGFSSVSSIGTIFGASLIDVAQAGIRAEGGLKGVIGLLRSSPLLAAGVVLTGISTAMALFGRETADTNSELSKQIQLQQELQRASLDLARQLQLNSDLQRTGFPVDQRSAGETRARRLVEVASGLSGQSGFQSFADLQGLTGLDESRLRAFSRSINGPGDIAQRTYQLTSNVQGTRTFTEDQGLTNAAAREVLLRLAQNLRENAATIPPEIRGGSEYGPFLPPGGLNNPQAPSNLFPDVRTLDGGVGYGSAIGPLPGEESPFARVARLNEIQDAERQLAEFNERLAQTRQLGLDVGNALGNSFFAFLQNANNARGVLVGLLQQLSAIAQQRIVSGFANSVGNLFGQTVTQQSSNPGFVGPPTAPGFQIDNN